MEKQYFIEFDHKIANDKRETQKKLYVDGGYLFANYEMETDKLRLMRR